MARQIRVEITGDSSSFERAIQRSARMSQQFARQTAADNRTVSRSFDPLLASVRQMRSEADNLSRSLEREREVEAQAAAARQRQLATVAAVGAGFFALGRAIEGAGAGLEVFQGHSSQTSQALGDAGQAIQSLITLDPAGFFRAVGASAQRTRDNLDNYNRSLDDVNQSERALQVAQAASAMGFDAQAQAIRDHVEELKAAQAATEAMDFAQRTFNQTVIDGTTYLVAFKGAHDAAFLGTPGPQVYGATPTTTTTPGRRTLPAMSPSQRRELELIGLQGAARLPDLRDRAAQLRGQLADFHGNQEQRLRLATQLRQTESEIAGILQAQADAQAASNREADERARKAREAARLAAAAAEQARQFRLIGLSPTGDAPTPTIANLRRQFEQIRGRVAAGDDLPQKMLDRFAGISKALRQDITPETREAIAEFFRAIRDEWKRGDDNLKPFATAGLNVNRVVSGLGLTAAQSRRLRARLSGATTAGQVLAPGAGVGAFGMWVQRQPIQTTVYLDGQVVGRSTKRYLSGDSQRSPAQKRGPHAGRW